MDDGLPVIAPSKVEWRSLHGNRHQEGHIGSTYPLALMRRNRTDRQPGTGRYPVRLQPDAATPGRPGSRCACLPHSRSFDRITLQGHVYHQEYRYDDQPETDILVNRVCSFHVSSVETVSCTMFFGPRPVSPSRSELVTCRSRRGIGRTDEDRLLRSVDVRE